MSNLYRMCSPKCDQTGLGYRDGVTYSRVPHRFVAGGADKRYHSEPVRDELVGQHARVRVDFYQVNGCPE